MNKLIYQKMNSEVMAAVYIRNHTEEALFLKSFESFYICLIRGSYFISVSSTFEISGL